MNVAVLLITHENIARNLLEVAASILNDKPLNMDYIEVPMDVSVEHIEFRIDEKLENLKREDGLLILTDIYGSTPSNIANGFARHSDARLVSGVNLPMLVKIMNYRSLAIDDLAGKAIDGGRDGISLYEQETV